jgi:hypothetical protein
MDSRFDSPYASAPGSSHANTPSYSNPLTSPIPTAPVQTAPEPVEVLPNPSVEAVEEAKAFAADIVRGVRSSPELSKKLCDEGLEIDATQVRADLEDLKDQINDSFGEVANLLLDLQRRFALYDERFLLFNARAGHKI